MKTQMLIGVVVPSVLVGVALAAQDKYTLTVPDGLAFSEFRGYEDWQTISVSYTEAQNVLRVILGNAATIKAYREGVPGDGKPFPEGSKIAMILWKKKQITQPPFSVSTPDTVPDFLDAVELMEKDTKRFPDTNGWGYGEFTYDAAPATFKPLGTGAKCGATCHAPAAKTDYVFTKYSAR
jgi:hypothetical protein